MAKRVKAAKVEFYNPVSGALRYTVTDDVALIDITEAGRDEADDAKIELVNVNATHTGRFKEGDEVRIYIRTEDDASLVHIWTGLIDSVKHTRYSSQHAVITILAMDYVYARLANAYVTDVYEGEFGGDIVKAMVQAEAPSINVTNVEATANVIDSLTFNGTSLLAAIRKVAELGAGEFYGDKDKKLYYFEKGTKSSGASVSPASVVRGTFHVEVSLAGMGNVIKVRGGSRSVLDKSNTTGSPSFSTLTGTTRKTARVYVSKSSLSQVELWTDTDTPSTLTGDLRVRVQADNEAGTAPIEVDNADRDICGRTLDPTFLANAGWTTFILPTNILPAGGYVWLIVECATDGQSQRVGVDGSGNLLYRTYYPVPIIVERQDQTSVDTYGERELPPINDANIATEEEANLVADEALARVATPQKVADFEAQDMTLATVTLGYTVSASFPNDGIPNSTAYIVSEKRHLYEAAAGTYSLHVSMVEAERVMRAEDIVQKVHERVRRLEDAAMGRAKGVITDLIRSLSETAVVADTASATEYTANAFVVGTAEVGFSSVG